MHFKKNGISYYFIIIKSYMILIMMTKKILLAPHGAQVVIAFSHYSKTGYFPNILLKPLKTNV